MDNPCLDIYSELVRKVTVNQLIAESQMHRGKSDETTVDWFLWAASECERVGADEIAQRFFHCAVLTEMGKGMI